MESEARVQFCKLCALFTCRLERLSVELVTGRTDVTTGMVSFVPLLVISHSSEEEEEEEDEH